jgi:hypothetical protein
MVSDETGTFVLSNMPQGAVEMTASLEGFQTQRSVFTFDGNPHLVEIPLNVAALMETVTVTAESPVIDTSTSGSQTQFSRRSPLPLPSPSPMQPQSQAPSQNVVNLQQRAAGVLPIRVDVPRAGVSHEFVKPLVVGDSPTVVLRYKRN